MSIKYGFFYFIVYCVSSLRHEHFTPQRSVALGAFTMPRQETVTSAVCPSSLSLDLFSCLLILRIVAFTVQQKQQALYVNIFVQLWLLT